MASSSEPADDRLLAAYEERHRILLVGEGDFSFTEALSDQLPSGQAPQQTQHAQQPQPQPQPRLQPHTQPTASLALASSSPSP
jgi:hypothetical protein